MYTGKEGFPSIANEQAQAGNSFKQFPLAFLELETTNKLSEPTL
jgi:hypothetical protein